MVVAAAIVLMLIAGDAIVKRDFAGQAAFRQQFQSAINGGETNAGILLLHQPVQFIGGKVLAGLQKGSQDGVALGGLFEADALKVFVQDLLRLADHLARDAGLIVNALLQHGWRGLAPAGTG